MLLHGFGAAIQALVSVTSRDPERLVVYFPVRFLFLQHPLTFEQGDIQDLEDAMKCRRL